nr:cation/H+ exchanger, cation/H+ exchanger, CPA1 family [Tanacetum cinerariifolium]
QATRRASGFEHRQCVGGRLLELIEEVEMDNDGGFRVVWIEDWGFYNWSRIKVQIVVQYVTSCLRYLQNIRGFREQTLEAAHLFKLDMISVKSRDMERFKGLDMSCKRWEEEDLEEILMSMKLWKELVDLRDAIFFVDHGRDNLTYYKPGMALELGGYIYICDRMENILYSYHVKENTISLSYMPSLVLPTSNISLWEC